MAKKIYVTRIYSSPDRLFFIKVFSTALAAIKELNRIKNMTEEDDKNQWHGYVTELRLNNECYVPEKIIDSWE